MAIIDTSPNSFTRDASSDSAADVMQVIYDFFNTDSALWSVDIEDGATTGFAVTPVGSETFQVNFRPAASDIEVLLDADGSITDSTNPTASAGDTQGEIAFEIQNGDVRFDFHEWADAFSILQIDGGATPYEEEGLHVGKVVETFFSSDDAAGMTGVAIALGAPNVSSGSDDWFTQSPTSRSYIRTAVGTWEKAGTLYNSSEFSGGADAVGGRKQPIPLIVTLEASERPVGFLKYLFGWDDNLGVHTIVDNPTDSKQFVAMYDSTSASARTLHPIEDGFSVAT